MDLRCVSYVNDVLHTVLMWVDITRLLSNITCYAFIRLHKCFACKSVTLVLEGAPLSGSCTCRFSRLTLDQRLERRCVQQTTINNFRQGAPLLHTSTPGIHTLTQPSLSPLSALNKWRQLRVNLSSARSIQMSSAREISTAFDLTKCRLIWPKVGSTPTSIWFKQTLRTNVICTKQIFPHWLSRKLRFFGASRFFILATSKVIIRVL